MTKDEMSQPYVCGITAAEVAHALALTAQVLAAHPRCSVCRQHHGPEFCWGSWGGSV